MLALGAAMLVLAVAFALPLWHMVKGAPPVAADPGHSQDLPWQVQALPGGRSRVFGLILGQDSVAQAQQRFADLLQVALVARVARVDQVGALEALVEPLVAGHASGRPVLAFVVPADTQRTWREQVSGSQVMVGVPVASNCKRSSRPRPRPCRWWDRALYPA